MSHAFNLDNKLHISLLQTNLKASKNKNKLTVSQNRKTLNANYAKRTEISK